MGKQLFKSSIHVSMATMISRVIGFARDVLFATFFGASAAYDAFVVAFKLPNFMRRLFGEGAFSQAFVPVLVGQKETLSEDDLRRFMGHVAMLLGLSLLVVVSLIELFAPQMIHLFAPGFHATQARFEIAVRLLHWMAPYLFFIVMVAYASAILNSYKKFFIPAITPVILNGCFIVAVALGFWLHYNNIMVLAYAVLISGFLQCALLWFGLYRLGQLPKLSWYFWQDKAVRRILHLMVPALFGVSVAQIGLVIDNIFASYLPVGSITWLYYSDRLTYLPLGVIGVALSTVVLPHLSAQVSKKNPEDFSKTLVWAFEIIWFIGMPTAVGLIFLSGPIIFTLLYHGAFDAHSAVMTSYALMAYSSGLPGFMFIKVGAPGFYARQKMATVVRIAAMAVGINIILDAILFFPLAHAGLALATALASTINAACLWGILIKQKVMIIKKENFLLIGKVFLASVAMGFCLYVLSGHWSGWLAETSFVRYLRLTGIICIGVIVYGGVSFLCGIRLKHFKSAE
jgi:putative peptidoglycan lipid II flippase